MENRPTFENLLAKIVEIENANLIRKEELIRKGYKFCPYCGEVYENTIFDINDSICGDISIDGEYNSGEIATECFCDSCGHFFLIETSWSVEVNSKVIEDATERKLYNLNCGLRDGEEIEEFVNENQLNLFEIKETANNEYIFR